jgi:biotin synthase
MFWIMEEEKISSKIRVSLGSAMLLNLTEGAMDVAPTTIYLLTYHAGKCVANCGFCSQARSSTSSAEMLSRVTWPAFPSTEVVNRIKNLEKGLIKRICIQTMNYPNMLKEVLELVRKIHSETNTPISVSSQPLAPRQIRRLKEAGIDRISVPLDAPTEKLFEEVKGLAAGSPYVWNRHMAALKKAVHILGRGRVGTHFIVGLGEKDEELLYMIQKMVDMGVYPALFAFTPIRGTRLERRAQPKIERYRRIQLAHYLITKGKATLKDIVFDYKGHLERALLKFPTQS